MTHGRLADGKIPRAEKDGLLGGTQQEGGDATKDVPNGSGAGFGSGNRHRDTSGATESTPQAEEGLSDDMRNMGSETDTAD